MICAVLSDARDPAASAALGAAAVVAGAARAKGAIRIGKEGDVWGGVRWRSEEWKEDAADNGVGEKDRTMG